MTYYEAKTAIPPYAIFRHFKGNLYEVLAIAQHSETKEPIVIYQDVNKRGIIWARPASMWFDEVSRGTKRFERYQCGMHVLTSEDWKPAKPIEYEPPNPPLWAKPLILLFDWYMRRKKNNGHE